MKGSVEYIRKDLYRYYEKEKLTITERIKMSPSIKYMILFRKIQFCKNPIIKKVLILRLNLKQRKTYIQIPYNTKIGKGFYIGHLGRVIINSNTTIGENVNIATGVTIGQINKGKKKGSPIIGTCMDWN